MIGMTRIFEGLVCVAFYAGICYLLFDGAGKPEPSPHAAFVCPGTIGILQSIMFWSRAANCAPCLRRDTGDTHRQGALAVRRNK